MSLEHLTLPKGKQVLKKPTVMEISQRGTGINGNSSQWPTLQRFEQQNKGILDYDLKYRINSCESILI